MPGNSHSGHLALAVAGRGHTNAKPHPVSVTREIRVVDRTLRPQPITGQRTPHSRYALILRRISSLIR